MMRKLGAFNSTITREGDEGWSGNGCLGGQYFAEVLFAAGACSRNTANRTAGYEKFLKPGLTGLGDSL